MVSFSISCRKLRLTKDATIGGTARLLKYSVCPKMARMTLSPANAPMKPHKHITQVKDGVVDFPRYPNHLLIAGGSRAKPFWMKRSTGTRGSGVGMLNKVDKAKRENTHQRLHRNK